MYYYFNISDVKIKKTANKLVGNHWQVQQILITMVSEALGNDITISSCCIKKIGTSKAQKNSALIVLKKHTIGILKRKPVPLSII